MLDVIVEFYKDGFNFSGRTSRSTFWLTIVFLVIIGYLLGLGTAALDSYFGNEQPFISYIVFGIIGLISIIPSFSMMVRRLHDADKPGLLVLLSFIPFGNFVLLILFCLPSVYKRS